MDSFEIFRPYLLVVVGIGIIRLVFGYVQFKRIAKPGILEIDRLGGFEFEDDEEED